ncbi:hypothetical protein P2318_24005 [Myxococcaceae bacterium GXIMD 01537]
MRHGFSGLVAAVVLCSAGSASAVELNYKWKKGEVHRFRYEDDTTLEMQMGGMAGMMPGMGAGAGMRLKVQSVFSQKVLGVRPDGTADLELNVEKLDLFQGEQRVATIAQLPPSARKLKAEVDRKGRARFFRMVTVYMKEGQWLVGVHNAQVGPGGGSASLSAGDTTVNVVGSVDPRSGKVSLAMNEKKRPPALTAVQVKEEDPGVDVLPKQLMEMMVLPEGDLTPGGRAEVVTPFGDMALHFKEQVKTVARLHTQFAGKSLAPAEPPPDAAAPADSAQPPDEAGPAADEPPSMGMGMGMGGMAMGMKMPGMPGMTANADAPQPGGTPKMDFDMTSGFDVAAGKLLSLEGTGRTEMSMGGAGGMKTNTRFALSRL